MYYVYILKCRDNTLYTGVTTDLRRRLRQHNGELTGGAKYTASRRPVTAVFHTSVPDRSSAQQLEIRIKSLTRRQKEELIAHPETIGSLLSLFSSET